MAFDGILIHHLINDISFLKSSRINKIGQMSPTDFLFTIRNQGKNYSLFISIHPEFCHFCLSNKEYLNDKNISNFTTLLRKYVEGGIINDIFQYETDRIIGINLTKNNEIGDRQNINLFIELTGRHSNIILCKENTIIDCYKHVNPFDNQDRTLIPSGIYTFPTTKKINPFNCEKEEIKKYFETIKSPKDMANCFLGISLLLANYSYMNYELFYNTITSYNPCLISGTKCFFYYTDLLYLDGKRVYYKSLSEAVDNYFYNQSKKAQISNKSNNILHLINSKIQKQVNKLDKLEQELIAAKENETERIKGELLFSNISNIPNNVTKVILNNYYTNEQIEIKLDPSLSAKKNANKYYSLYQKKKSALTHLPLQIENTLNEIEYLKTLESQIEVANINDIADISLELNESSKKAKPKKPTFTRYIYSDYEIIIGKNNVQNAFLIKEVAKSSDLWFHVKDAPSSHVVLKGLVNEESIRLASMLCAYYSKSRYSSSVPIDYTLIKHLKRIPEKRGCFVRYTNQKTIYIDPDIDLIESLKPIIK